MITYEDFAKLEIKIGKIIACEKVENTDKLLKLTVDINEEQPRTIVSGIAEWYQPEDLIGKFCPFLVNLEPRKLRGIDSQGMILAADTDGSAVLLHPDKEIQPGTNVR